jgi:hypothetical protein
MPLKYSLQQMRDVWIQAYFSTDIEQLQYVEADCFFVKIGNKVQNKQQQLFTLTHKRDASSVHASMQMQDLEVTFREEKGWASVQGTGRTLHNEQVVNSFVFCELWFVEGDRWRVAALCIDACS